VSAVAEEIDDETRITSVGRRTPIASCNIGPEPVGVTGDDGKPSGVRAFTPDSLVMSDDTRRLFDALDEVIAVGALVSLAARHASEDP